MDDLNGRVAVVTGAASGIGLAVSEGLLGEGMKVVLADISQENLDRVEADLLSYTNPDRLLSLKIDVGKKQDILRLANKAQEKFGHIDLLFNHAGMPGPVGPIWTASYEDIERVVQVNILSMMYSLRTFAPIMMQQDTPGHIVNTSSGAGLHIGFDMSCYITTKHAVVALSETLSLDLEATQSKIHVSVLCPGMVDTNFADMVADTKESDSEAVKKLKVYFEENIRAKGIPVEQLVDETFDAIRNEQFYILTHFDEHASRIKATTDNMLAGNNPIDLFRE